MKKSIIAGIFLSLAMTANAQDKVSGAPVAPDPLPPVIKKPVLPPNCKLYKDMTKTLQDDYGEYPLFTGITKGGRSLRETFINVETGSYTDLVITPKKSDLVACIVGSGKGAVFKDPVLAHTI